MRARSPRATLHRDTANVDVSPTNELNRMIAAAQAVLAAGGAGRQRAAGQEGRGDDAAAADRHVPH